MKDSKTKQKGIPKNLIIIGAVVLVLIVIGYAVQNFVMRMAGEKLAAGLIKSRTGVEVDIKSGGEGVMVAGKDGGMEIGKTAQWPSDMPPDVPKFPAGTVVMSTNVNNSWTVILKNITKGDVEKYVAELQKNGWQAADDVKFLVEMTEMEKGAYRINVVYDASSNGVSITVRQKDQ